MGHKDREEVERARKVLQSEKELRVVKPKHDLRTVKQNFYGLKYSPKEFNENTPAGVVFFNLMVCYDRAKNVSEGQIGDIIWAFKQSGIPGPITFDGFKELKKHKYLDFITPTGELILGDPDEDVFFRWTDKFFNMLLEEESKESAAINRVETEATTWDKVTK